MRTSYDIMPRLYWPIPPNLRNFLQVGRKKGLDWLWRLYRRSHADAPESAPQGSKGELGG